MKFIQGASRTLFVLGLIIFGLYGAKLGTLPQHNLSIRELNTTAFVCDGENHRLDSELQNVQIRKIVVWFGAYDYTNADIVFSLEKVGAENKWQSIAKAGWDHYAAPVGAAGQVLTYDFAPDWIALNDEDTLTLYYSCNPMNEDSKTKKAHLIVMLYYLDDGQ